MVFTTFVAKIAAGVDSKLFADSIVRRNVVFVVSLAEGGVSRQGAHALDTAHLKQYSPNSEINVKQIKRTQLRTKFQFKKHLT